MFCKRERSQLLPLKRKMSWLLNICLVDIILSDPSEDGRLFLVTLGYFLEESQCLDFFRSLDWIDFVTSAHVSGSALLSCCSVVFHQRTAIKFHENPHRDDVLTSITHNTSALGVFRVFFPVSLLCYFFLVATYISVSMSTSIYIFYICLYLYFYPYLDIHISLHSLLLSPHTELCLYTAISVISLYINLHTSLCSYLFMEKSRNSSVLD